MKQLLLLLTIHFMIFYQQKKDRKEKFLNTLEKKNVVTTRQQKDRNFLFPVGRADYDSLYFFQSPRQTAYSMVGYSYVTYKP